MIATRSRLGTRTESHLHSNRFFGFLGLKNILMAESLFYVSDKLEENHNK